MAITDRSRDPSSAHRWPALGRMFPAPCRIIAVSRGIRQKMRHGPKPRSATDGVDVAGIARTGRASGPAARPHDM